MRHSRVSQAVRFLGATLLIMAAVLPARAQPLQDRILGDVEAIETDGCIALSVGFNIPIVYLRHFPAEAGEELLIFVWPVGVSPGDMDTILQREWAPPPPATRPTLLDIEFEGDAPGGPYLSLRFTQRIPFHVRQGRDNRSIDVFIPNAASSEPCAPDR